MNMSSMLGGLPLWAAAVPLIVGLLFVWVGLRTFNESRRRRRTWTRRTGLVVGSRLSDGQIQAQVTFSDETGPVTFWNRYTTSFATDEVGQSVEVLVNPDDRSDAVVANGPAGPGFVAGAFAGFGVFAIGSGVIMLMERK